MAILGPLLAAVGCHTHGGAEESVSTTGVSRVSGQVVTEAGAPLANAQVVISGQEAVAAAADGTFAIDLASRNGPTRAVTVTAPGYATVFRALGSAGTGEHQLGQVPLRQAGEVVTKTLPAAGEPPLTIEMTRDDGGVALEVGAGQLVDANGTVATGEVEVALQYWHPNEDLASAPALLLADEGDTTVGLKCFGMAGVEISQNSRPLAVASGQAVALKFRQPPNLAALWAGPGPALYSLDEDTGLWRPEGGRGDGALSFNADTKVATARLGHLSYWNVDGAIYPSNGGCVSGRAFDACSPQTPLSNTPIRVWFLSYEELKDFQAKTGSDGRYCAATPISDYQAIGNKEKGDPLIEVNFLVTGSDIENTTMCNPLPPDCRTCSPLYEGWPESTNFCNACVMDIPNSYLYAVLPSYRHYEDTCKPPTPSVQPQGCTFCPGTSPAGGRCTLPGSDGTYSQGKCADLGITFLKSASCHCASTGNTCGPGGQCCPTPDGTMAFCSVSSGRCQPCTKFKKAFDSCGSEEPCCTHFGDPALTCLDNVCVPQAN